MNHTKHNEKHICILFFNCAVSLNFVNDEDVGNYAKKLYVICY